jgi:hypothetical protein
MRGETADAGERFCQANEIALTYEDERGRSGHANARDRTSMATPPRNRLAAGQRQRWERGEVAGSRGQVVALEGALRPRSLVPPRERRRPIVRLIYATGSAPSIPVCSAAALVTVPWFSLGCEQGAHKCRGRADGQ